MPMQGDDRLRNLFGEFDPAPEPTGEQRERARAALHRAMAADPGPERRRRRAPAIAWAAAVTGAIVVATVLFLPSTTPAVDANLANIAAAARTVPTSQLPDGSYIYFRSESLTRVFNETATGVGLTYLLPETVDVWVSGSSEAERRTVRDPVFDSASDREIYFASDLPETEGIGRTTQLEVMGINERADVEALSTDPTALRDQLLAELRADPEFSETDEIRIANHLVELLEPRFNAPPPLRAALLEVLGGLDVATRILDNDHVLVELEYTEPGFGVWQQDYEFDTAGFLRRDRLILLVVEPGVDDPLGVHAEITFTPPQIVATVYEVPPG